MITSYANCRHTIHHGDAVEVLASDNVPRGSVDLVFVDPPYNIGKNFNGWRDEWPSEEAYFEWVADWLDLCIAALKPTGSLYLMCATQYFAHFDLLLRQRLTILSRIVWHYDSSGRQARRYFGSLWEPIFHCVADPKKYTFNAEAVAVEAKTGSQRKLVDYRKRIPSQYGTKKVPGNAWYFPRVRYRMPEYEEHPSQKPLALLERIIAASSNQDDTILDPFAGTFTAGHAAANLNRKSINIEIDEQYTKIGLRRLEVAKHYGLETLQQPEKVYKQKLPKRDEAGRLFE